MGKVLDFNSKWQAIKEHEEAVQMKGFFVEMFGDQPDSVKLEIAQAIKDKDVERYFEITHPIIIRKTMKEMN
ncbi:hypothetical protein [Cytobacillus depressus]|uniref:hypothetical protein n=1 Tax=Cytobacillus depressus TaxID=1602942 RepID=UPI0014781CAF|nr:hypothetical protein [Cytobacillus depressus]